MTVLVTGSSGFIGNSIAKALLALHLDVVLPQRARVGGVGLQEPVGKAEIVGEINAFTDWEKLVKGVETIVHCAAISEVGENSNSQHLQALWSVNVDGTLNLARQAASLGVKRFVFLSSIKVNGESTRLGMPFTHDGKLLPKDAYGLSKLEAERGLQNISRISGMEFVIIRPPMVYGPAVKGNFEILMKLVQSGIPLPLSSIRNKRSFIGIDNLVDLVISCISHPKAANQIFLTSDDNDLSTAALLRGIAQAMEQPSRLFPCPPIFLLAAAKSIGKTALAEKLLGSLQINISETKRLLGWRPPFTVGDSLSRCFPKL